MKVLFWVLVFCGMGWIVFIAINSPQLIQNSDKQVPSGRNDEPLHNSNLSTNVWDSANLKIKKISTNTVRRLKGVDVENYFTTDSLDEAGLALKSFSNTAVSFFSGFFRDGWIITAVRTELVRKLGPDLYQINVESNDGEVSLSGNVGSSSIRDNALEIAESTKWVTAVTDNLTLKNN